MVTDNSDAQSLSIADALARGYTLPADWYTSPGIFALEKRRIFGRWWQYVGLVEDLPGPGDFLTYQAGSVPIVILRDGNRQLRAFVNVCRHRGSQLILAERGNRKSLQCHYHAWTYDLDGSLRAAPGSNLEPGFCKDELSLLPVQVDTWGSFLFVNPDPQAVPLAEMLGELPELVEATGLRLDRIRRRERRTYQTRANWKVVVDNYLECYHCPVAHPSFCDLIDVAEYHVSKYEYFSTQTAPMKASARQGKRNPYGVGEGVEDGFYAYLWPNFMVNIYPGPGNVSLNLILPLDVDRTLAIYEYCFVDSVSDETVQEFSTFIDQVQREDIVLCESVQRGLQSGFFQQGRLMLSRENGLQHFQQLVYRVMTAD
jgi:choline monooxygenase